MLKYFVIVASLSSPALAVEAPTPASIPSAAATAAPAKEVDAGVKMNYNEILALYNALTALDGYQKVVMEGGKEKSIAQAYDFSADTRNAIADGEAELKKIIDEENGKLRLYGKSLGADGQRDCKTDEPDEACRKAHTEWGDHVYDLGRKEFSVSIARLTREELKEDVNKIPPSVISALKPITVAAPK